MVLIDVYTFLIVLKLYYSFMCIGFIVLYAEPIFINDKTATQAYYRVLFKFILILWGMYKLFFCLPYIIGYNVKILYYF